MPPTIIADAAPVAFSIDYNTILTTAVLAVTGWTLRSVIYISRKIAVSDVREAQHEKDMLELRARITTVEIKQQELELLVSGCQAKNCR